MTCVIGLRADNGRVFLAGDSFSEVDDVVYRCSAPKVYQVGEVGFGICGNVKSEQIVEQVARKELTKRKTPVTVDWLTHVFTEKVRKQMSQQGVIREDTDDRNGVSLTDHSNYLVAFDGNLYLFNEDFSLWDVRESFMAIGKGRMIATGALAYALENGLNGKTIPELLEHVLDISAHYTCAVQRPYTVIEV